jgi:tetratricopeptide (TPR) repeat protein
MRQLLILLAFLAVPSIAAACIWDSDTLQEELESRGDALRTITGETIRHGEAYYTRRAQDATETLADNPEDLEAHYDAAAAWLRLGAYAKARHHLAQAEALAPGRYKTLANLSAVAEREGKLDEALTHWRTALDKRPDAHFGAGFLHLRMLEWKLAAARTKGAPTRNMLGSAYTEKWPGSLYSAEKKFLASKGLERDGKFDYVELAATFVRANPDFAEGYYVLGLTLQDNFDLNLALWSFVQAKRLGHPSPKAVDDRIAQIFAHWKDALKHTHARSKPQITSIASAVASIDAQLAEAAKWPAHWARVESDLIRDKGTLPNSGEVRAALTAQGIEPITPKPAGLVGTAVSGGSPARGMRSRGAPSEGKQQSPANDAENVRSAPNQSAQADVHAEPQVQQAGQAMVVKSEEEAPPTGNAASDSETVWLGPPSDAQQPPVMATAHGAAPGVLAAQGPAAGDATSSKPAPQDSGMPWYVIFGAGMLLVSLSAVAIARARREG